MGTWGAGPFDNDAAADWLDQLDDSSVLEQITVALAAASPEGPIPADAAAVAVAAAEVVARERIGWCVPFGRQRLPEGRALVCAQLCQIPIRIGLGEDRRR